MYESSAMSRVEHNASLAGKWRLECEAVHSRGDETDCGGAVGGEAPICPQLRGPHRGRAALVPPPPGTSSSYTQRPHSAEGSVM